MDDEKKLTIILLREGSATVAQCLEYDIAAEGDTAAEALGALADVFAGQIVIDQQNGIEPLSTTPPAIAGFATVRSNEGA